MEEKICAKNQNNFTMAEIKRKVLIPVDGSPNSQKAFDCKFLQQKFCFKRLFFQNLMGQTTNNDRQSIEQSVERVPVSNNETDF